MLSPCLAADDVRQDRGCLLLARPLSPWKTKVKSDRYRTCTYCLRTSADVGQGFASWDANLGDTTNSK